VQREGRAMANDQDPQPLSQTEHSPMKKAVIITIGMLIGLVILYFAVQFGAKPPTPPTPK
jgi:hypothetical protein